MKEYAANAEKHLSQNLADKYFVVDSTGRARLQEINSLRESARLQ